MCVCERLLWCRIASFLCARSSQGVLMAKSATVASQQVAEHTEARRSVSQSQLSLPRACAPLPPPPRRPAVEHPRRPTRAPWSRSCERPQSGETRRRRPASMPAGARTGGGDRPQRHVGGRDSVRCGVSWREFAPHRLVRDVARDIASSRQCHEAPGDRCRRGRTTPLEAARPSVGRTLGDPLTSRWDDGSRRPLQDAPTDPADDRPFCPQRVPLHRE